MRKTRLMVNRHGRSCGGPHESICDRQPAKAFTLIELLVVITIIVVLLALLTPALDRAVYQAELASCGARLKSIPSSMTFYATDHRRHYPLRRFMPQGINERPILLAFQVYYPALTYDDRPPLRPYLSINKLLNCPLSRAVTLDGPGINPESSAYTPYAMWWGYGYAGEKTMVRLGDATTFLGDRSTLVAADWDAHDENNQGDWGAHPDHDDRMVSNSYENFVVYGTVAHWQGISPRGDVDLNYAFQDGSVLRYTGVKHMDPDRVGDPRMWNWPAQFASGDAAVWRVQVPRQ